jgi:rhomboid protease GluP
VPKPYLTYLIILVNVIVFQQENQWGGTENLQTLHALGALTTEDVLKGEWWRLVTANFLHHGWFHLGANMLGLYYIGSIIESYLGRIRYLLIYFASGCLSMLLMVFYFLKIGEPQTLLVGASAAIMGLIGAMGAIFLQDWWQEKSSLARQRFMFVLLVVGIQFLIDYNTPHVSLISHVFGLIIGFMVGLILIRETT